ncbi:MAG: hypothetical protein HUU34_15230 [Saprospiraceae bacterium]|nr:hypothetical protein [Saprospiraceae bacterium]
MKKNWTTSLRIFVGTISFVFLLPLCVQAVTYNIFSGLTWEVYDNKNNFLGYAQNVCLNAALPVNCPMGATQYGYTLGGWTASIPGATWIWAPNVSGTTSPAANQEFIFKTVFFICGNPTGGTISVAADNQAEVVLNGNPIGTSTSNTVLSNFTISPALIVKNFPNYIEVKVRNGANPADCQSDQYRCNPAGLLFGAYIKDDLPNLPGCGETQHSEYEKRICQTADGRNGEQFRQCLCGYWFPWSPCSAPPTPPCQLTIFSATPSACSPSTNTYTLSVKVNYSNAPSGDIVINGQNFPANGSGSVYTLTGLAANGAAGVSVNVAFAANSSCSASATYNAPINCTPICIGNNGVRFNIGATETLPCSSGCGSEQTHTCLLSADGTKGEWSPLIGCKVMANAGEKCWDTRTGEDEKCCPEGFHCERRPTTKPPCNRPWWCFLALWIPGECKCSPSLISTEFICVPN